MDVTTAAADEVAVAGSVGLGASLGVTETGLLIGAEDAVHVFGDDMLSSTPSVYRGVNDGNFTSVLEVNGQFLLGAPEAGGGDGRVYQAWGITDFGEQSLDGYLVMQPPLHSGWRVGQVVVAGDLDGMGVPDIVVTAPGYGSDNQGLAGVFLGGSLPMDFLSGDVFITTPKPESRITTALIADLTGDGFDDLILGAPGYEQRGAVFVLPSDGAPLFEPGQDPIWLTLEELPRRVQTTTGPGDCAGATLAVIPELIADTHNELVIGSPCADGGTGKVAVISGSWF